MSDWHQNQPDEFDDLVHRLREQRPEADALQLDRMKTRARARALSSQPKGSVVRTRLIVALCSLGLMAGGTGGVIAAKGGNPGPPPNAGQGQYKGKHCGNGNDKNVEGPKKPNQQPCPPQAGPKK